MGETALIFFSFAVAARDRRLQEYFIWAFFLGKHRTPRPHTHKCNSTHNHSHIIAFFQEETDYPVLRCRSDIRVCAQLSLPLSSYTITLPLITYSFTSPEVTARNIVLPSFLNEVEGNNWAKRYSPLHSSHHSNCLSLLSDATPLTQLLRPRTLAFSAVHSDVSLKC